MGSGRVCGGCRPVGVYAHAYLTLSSMPSDTALGAALDAAGWSKGNGTRAYATRALPEGHLAILRVDTAQQQLMATAVDSFIYTEEESRAMLRPAVDPLAHALGTTALYQGGGEHCGRV